MRENCKSGSMRGCRKRAVTQRACVLLYGGLSASRKKFWDAPFVSAAKKRLKQKKPRGCSRAVLLSWKTV
jgi:hypothetical protein